MSGWAPNVPMERRRAAPAAQRIDVNQHSLPADSDFRTIVPPYVDPAEAIFRSTSPESSSSRMSAMTANQAYSQDTPNPTAGGNNPRFHQPTKREKRKNAMVDRLRDISANFAENREYHYRRQLQSLQRDVNYITYAQPYRDQPLEELDDSDGDGLAFVSGIVSGNGERQPRPGKWARKFEEEMDNAVEDRDAQLTLIVERHNFAIRGLKDDYEYWTSVADKECTSLLNTLKARLVQNIQMKKAVLLKERDKMEVSDSASLLLNPTQFSFTNPASPGGPQSNRKTRHTRHRLGIDDIASASDSKRKRKIAVDADEGSPAPPDRTLDVEPIVSVKESLSTRPDPYQSLAPTYSMTHLFTDKELVMTTQDASYATIQELSAKRRKENHNHIDQQNPASLDTLAPRQGVGNGHSQRQQKNGKKNNISTNPTTANASDAEGNSDTNPLTQTDGGADTALLDDNNNDIFLTAPAMDRTLSTNTSNNIYSTRSTRNTHPLSHLSHLPFSSTSTLNTLGPLAGRAAAIRLLGSYTKERKQAGEEYNRAPGLTEQEIEDDFAMIAATFKEGSGGWNGRLAEEVANGNEGDWIGEGDGEERVGFVRGGSGSEGEEEGEGV